MKAAEIRDLTNDEIHARIEQLHEELFRLRFRAATVRAGEPDAAAQRSVGTWRG